MGLVTTPVRLTLAESAAVALDGLARELDHADDAGRFMSALGNNHRLWTAMAKIARRKRWTALCPRTAAFVMAKSQGRGRGASDDQVEALIGINRDMSARLIEGDDLSNLRQRAMIEWLNAKTVSDRSLESWLIEEIEQNARGH